MKTNADLSHNHDRRFWHGWLSLRYIPYSGQKAGGNHCADNTIGRKPTSSSSEAPVSMAEGSMPWQTSSKGDGADEHFKYQYHPGGDRNKPTKDAPSALHSVIVPNVTLSKVEFNIIKVVNANNTDGASRKLMIHSISTVRRDFSQSNTDLHNKTILNSLLLRKVFVLRPLLPSFIITISTHIIGVKAGD